MTEKQQKILEIATPILAGLLASGHYTRTDNDDGTGEPYVFTTNLGKTWKESGLPLPHQSNAVADAIAMADELMKYVEFEHSDEG